MFAASWSVSQASLFITPFHLKITRSYRNSAESHVSFTQLPPMMLLYVPAVRAGKLTSSLFCRESCIWVKAGAQIQTALSALFGQHPLSASTSFLLEGRGTSALPPQTLIRNPPLLPPKPPKCRPRVASLSWPKLLELGALRRVICLLRLQRAAASPSQDLPDPPWSSPAPGSTSRSLPPLLSLLVGVGGGGTSPPARRISRSNSGLAGWPLTSVPAAGLLPGPQHPRQNGRMRSQLCGKKGILFGVG